MKTIRLIRGDDPVLVSEAVSAAIDELIGDADRSLVLEELTESNYQHDDAVDLRSLVDACGTPPFLTDYRVVVGREMGSFTKAADVVSLVTYLESPLDTTRLILVYEKAPSGTRNGAPPKSLLEALKAAGGTDQKTTIGGGKQAGKWLDDQMAAADVAIEPRAKRLIADRLGEDRSRVGALLETLASAFGPEKRLSEQDVAPYIGDAGSVPPWDLTDAIADGSMAKAVDAARRMTANGARHPLQLMASLHNHYERLLRLDGSGASSEQAAAAVLGIKGSTFPAKKALNHGRRMGHDKIARAISLLAEADLDLRGATAIPAETVLEVLVARLAHLSR